VTKSAGNTHARRLRSDMTLCGRRIVGVAPRPQQVLRRFIVTKPETVTCKSCRSHLGLEPPMHGRMP
jgi:hypothetical protein